MRCPLTFPTGSLSSHNWTDSEVSKSFASIRPHLLLNFTSVRLCALSGLHRQMALVLILSAIFLLLALGLFIGVRKVRVPRIPELEA